MISGWSITLIDHDIDRIHCHHHRSVTVKQDDLSLWISLTGAPPTVRVRSTTIMAIVIKTLAIPCHWLYLNALNGTFLRLLRVLMSFQENSDADSFRFQAPLCCHLNKNKIVWLLPLFLSFIHPFLVSFHNWLDSNRSFFFLYPLTEHF